MPKSRPPYPPAFRRRMVELVRTARTPEELARGFEPTAQAIRNWVARADRDEGRERLEARMILNHKDAIEFLVAAAAQIGFHRHTILNRNRCRSFGGADRMSRIFLANPYLKCGFSRNIMPHDHRSPHRPDAHP